MGDEKSFTPQGNDEIRGYVRAIIKERGGQTEAAEAMGVAQGYLSDFLNEKRGAGAKILAGIASLHPELAGRLLALRANKKPVSLPRVPVVPDDVARVARSILEKRGWSEGEIEAGARRSKLTTQADASDPVAVADAWELPLLGRQRERRPKSLSPSR